MLNVGPAQLAGDQVFLDIHINVGDSRVGSEVERGGGGRSVGGQKKLSDFAP